VRLATFWLVGLLAVGACNDVRDFAGEWHGTRVGDSPVLRVGGQPGQNETARLTIDAIDTHGLRGQLLVFGSDIGFPLVRSSFQSLEGAEADALASMTFAGAPIRVYLAFVPSGGGQALAVISLYDSRRIELRLLEGDPPLYAIFPLTEGP
jgi:hypothetical protein